MLLDGKVVVITGAGRGIGREEALLMAKLGAKVVVNDLGGSFDGSGANVGPAQEVVDEIKKTGGEAVANGDSVSDFKGAAHHRMRDRHLRQAERGGEQRRHPARPDDLQHVRGGLGLRRRGALEGHVQLLAARLLLLARAAQGRQPS